MSVHKPIIEALVESHLDALQTRRYSARTIATYRAALKRFAAYIADRKIRRIQDVTGQHLEGYHLSLLDQQFSEHTIDGYMRCIRQFFAYLEENQHLFTDPAADLVVRRPPRRLLSVPTEKDIAKLLAQPDTATAEGVRDRAWLEVLYSTGIRLQELATLNVCDSVLAQGRLRVFGKGAKERVVPLGRQAVHWLREYLQEVRPSLLKNEDEPALWLGTRCGRRLHTNQIQDYIRAYAQKAGLKGITPHALRRACATHMLHHGAHPIQIQLLLGHSNMRNLSQYLRVTIAELREMHAKTRLGM